MKLLDLNVRTQQLLEQLALFVTALGTPFGWCLACDSLETGGEMLRRGEAELTGNRGNRGRGVLQIALGPFNTAGKDKGVRRDACEPFEPLQKAGLRKRGAPRQLIDRIILPRIRAYLLHNSLYTRHG